MKQVKPKLDKDFPGMLRLPIAAYQLKITLRDIDPPIWRRVVVPSDIRLGKLHSTLQDTMGWTNSHLHEFVIGSDHYGVKDPDSPETKPEARVVLEDVFPEEGCEFTYLYDFGDGWEHDVVVEKIGPWKRGQRGSLCLEGARACPPEDVGGPHGYDELVNSMRGPDTEERREFIQWLGREFDPEAFSTKEVNACLRLRG